MYNGTPDAKCQEFGVCPEVKKMNIGVIFAGGVGSRCNMLGRPKQFVEVNGKPIIVHTLEHFEKCGEIDKVAVVCLADWIGFMWELTAQYNLKKVEAVVPGGTTGQESIYHGLLAAQKLSGGEKTVVLIHDGVRPIIHSQLLKDNIAGVREYGSAITCARATETPVRSVGDMITDSCPRAQALIAKAPQSFWLEDILEAHEEARRQGKNDYIDSCTLMMQHKPMLHYVECGASNIKITTFEDVYLMQALLRAKEDRFNFMCGQD